MYVYYSERRIQKLLRINTALIFKFIYIHPFINKSIKLQSINTKVFQLKYSQCISLVLFRIFVVKRGKVSHIYNLYHILLVLKIRFITGEMHLPYST